MVPPRPVTAGVRRGTIVLSAGQMAGYVLSFVRNLILARLLAKADYGLAALFGMAVTLLEINGRMALGTQVVQAEEGDSAAFMGTAQTLQFVGGCCSAMLLALGSFPLARLFHVPTAGWAFASLALVPLMQGFAHLDVARRQRRMDFVPFVVSDVAAQFAVTLLVWPLAIWIRDYRVILLLMLIKAGMTTAITYAFAQSPYEWRWHRLHAVRILNFGWPLLITGLVIFAAQQADQLIVGAMFSLNVLATYALAFSLVSIPYSIFGQVVSSLALPIMSRAQNDLPRLRTQYRICAQVAATAGATCSVPLIVIGEWLVTSLYGAKYAGAGPFMAVLGASAAARFLRYAPAVAALAKADTINQLISNLWRAVSLPLALAVWMIGGGPLHIASCALAGEFFAVGVSLLRLAKRQQIPLRDTAGPAIYLATLAAVAAIAALVFPIRLSFGWALVIGVIATAVPLALASVVFPEITHVVWNRVRHGTSTAALEASAS